MELLRNFTRRSVWTVSALYEVKTGIPFVGLCLLIALVYSDPPAGILSQPTIGALSGVTQGIPLQPQPGISIRLLLCAPYSQKTLFVANYMYYSAAL